MVSSLRADDSLGVRTVYNYIWLDSIPVAQFRERCWNVCQRTGRAFCAALGSSRIPSEPLKNSPNGGDKLATTSTQKHTIAHKCTHKNSLFSAV